MAKTNSGEKTQQTSKHSTHLDEVDAAGDRGQSGHNAPPQTVGRRTAVTGQQAHWRPVTGLLSHTPVSTLGKTLSDSTGKQRTVN